ncbi:MAG: short-chain dehydrogenase [Chitinophagaceae bacterium]|nr:short-chain dehydrogenase [Chitinophagaceae bacterium]
MTTELIEKFVENKNRKGESITIHFKQRSTFSGIFINGSDYEELKTKNFWRIVNSKAVEEWKRTSNMDLARIFNGLSFSRLTEQ